MWLVVPLRVEGEVAEQFALFAQDPDVEVGDRTMTRRPLWARPAPT